MSAWSTPVTSAPRAFAIWTASMPTPPPAPLTSTLRPGCTLARPRRFVSAMKPAVGTAAACTNVTLAGLRASTSSGTATYSA